MDNLPAIVPEITLSVKMTFGYKFLGVGDMPTRTIEGKTIESSGTYYKFADGKLVFKESHDPHTTP